MVWNAKVRIACTFYFFMLLVSHALLLSFDVTLLLLLLLMKTVITCSEAFTEDDWKLVQLVLTLFRNILAVQDIPLQQKAGGSAIQYVSLRDRFLELLFNENVLDIIIVITQHVCGSCGYFRQDNLLLLEIFHYIFMGQDPELIAKAHQRGSKVDPFIFFFFFSYLFFNFSRIFYLKCSIWIAKEN